HALVHRAGIANTNTATPTLGMTFVGAGSSFGAAGQMSSVLVKLPAGVQQGDILLATIQLYDAATNQPSAPAGWSLVRRDTGGPSPNVTSWVYWKLASASEPSSYGFSISLQWAASICVAYRGANANGPIDTSSGQGANLGRAPVAPSSIPNSNNELEVVVYAVHGGFRPTALLPTSLSSRINNNQTSTNVTFALGDIASPTTGTASSSYTATVSGNNSSTGQQIFLIPASQAAAVQGRSRPSQRRVQQPRVNRKTLDFSLLWSFE